MTKVSREEKEQIRRAKLFRRYGIPILTEIVEDQPKSRTDYEQWCYHNKTAAWYWWIGMIFQVLWLIELISITINVMSGAEELEINPMFGMLLWISLYFLLMNRVEKLDGRFAIREMVSQLDKKKLEAFLIKRAKRAEDSEESEI